MVFYSASLILYLTVVCFLIIIADSVTTQVGI